MRKRLLGLLFGWVLIVAAGCSSKSGSNADEVPVAGMRAEDRSAIEANGGTFGAGGSAGFMTTAGIETAAGSEVTAGKEEITGSGGSGGITQEEGSAGFATAGSNTSDENYGGIIEVTGGNASTDNAGGESEPDEQEVRGGSDESEAPELDQDGDGFTVSEGDCNDLLRTVFPNAAENCNGTDDDCDGRVDEGLAHQQITCGVGACERMGARVCEAGSWQSQCVAAQPFASEMRCDGMDDDCDGRTDENFAIGMACVEGGGVCVNEGIMVCNALGDGVECIGEEIPPAQADNNCNGQDEDCDGQNDEAYPIANTFCGVGACRTQGTRQCVNGRVTNQCVPRIGAADEVSCDGMDEDCDGRTDENYPTLGEECQVGLGVCQVEGAYRCNGARDGVTCVGVPGMPLSLSDPTCDGIDDDCDGLQDEDAEPRPLSCGIGPCAAEAEQVCENGQWQGECIPNERISAIDGSCDAVDDDCDGALDEDFWGEPFCGTGFCRISSTPEQCVDGVIEVCEPGEPREEVCNAIDDNCNDQIDEINPFDWGPRELMSGKAPDLVDAGNGTTALAYMYSYDGAYRPFFNLIFPQGAIIDRDTYTGQLSARLDASYPVIAHNPNGFKVLWTRRRTEHGETYAVEGQNVTFEGEADRIEGSDFTPHTLFIEPPIFSSPKVKYLGETVAYAFQTSRPEQGLWVKVGAHNFVRLAEPQDGEEEDSVYGGHDISWSFESLLVVWTDKRDGGPENEEIYFARVNLEGVVIGEETRLSFIEGRSHFPKVLWDGEAYGVTWVDEREDAPGIYFARVSLEGEVLRRTVRRVLEVAPETLHPQRAGSRFEYDFAWNGEEYSVVTDQADFVAFGRDGMLRMTPINLGFPPTSKVSLVWSGGEYRLAWVQDGEIWAAGGMLGCRIAPEQDPVLGFAVCEGADCPSVCGEDPGAGLECDVECEAACLEVEVGQESVEFENELLVVRVPEEAIQEDSILLSAKPLSLSDEDFIEIAEEATLGEGERVTSPVQFGPSGQTFAEPILVQRQLDEPLDPFSIHPVFELNEATRKWENATLLPDSEPSYGLVDETGESIFFFVNHFSNYAYRYDPRIFHARWINDVRYHVPSGIGMSESLYADFIRGIRMTSAGTRQQAYRDLLYLAATRDGKIDGRIERELMAKFEPVFERIETSRGGSVTFDFILGAIGSTLDSYGEWQSAQGILPSSIFNSLSRLKIGYFAKLAALNSSQIISMTLVRCIVETQLEQVIGLSTAIDRLDAFIAYVSDYCSRLPEEDSCIWNDDAFERAYIQLRNEFGRLLLDGEQRSWLDRLEGANRCTDGVITELFTKKLIGAAIRKLATLRWTTGPGGVVLYLAGELGWNLLTKEIIEGAKLGIQVSLLDTIYGEAGGKELIGYPIEAPNPNEIRYLNDEQRRDWHAKEMFYYLAELRSASISRYIDNVDNGFMGKMFTTVGDLVGEGRDFRQRVTEAYQRDKALYSTYESQIERAFVTPCEDNVPVESQGFCNGDITFCVDSVCTGSGPGVFCMNGNMVRCEMDNDCAYVAEIEECPGGCNVHGCIPTCLFECEECHQCNPQTENCEPVSFALNGQRVECSIGTCVPWTGQCLIDILNPPDPDPDPDPNECAEQECNNHGTCIENPEVQLCECFDRYNGFRCDQCAPGFENYPNCTRIDPCRGVNCAQGQCLGGACQCDRSKYAGSRCERCRSGRENYPICDPIPEICNGVDEDNDGAVDEEIFGEQNPNQQPLCQNNYQCRSNAGRCEDPTCFQSDVCNVPGELRCGPPNANPVDRNRQRCAERFSCLIWSSDDCPPGSECQGNGQCVQLGEICDGQDNDGDITIDEGASCPFGQECEGGACRNVLDGCDGINNDGDAFTDENDDCPGDLECRQGECRDLNLLDDCNGIDSDNDGRIDENPTCAPGFACCGHCMPTSGPPSPIPISPSENIRHPTFRLTLSWENNQEAYRVQIRIGRVDHNGMHFILQTIDGVQPGVNEYPFDANNYGGPNFYYWQVRGIRGAPDCDASVWGEWSQRAYFEIFN